MSTENTEALGTRFYDTMRKQSALADRIYVEQQKMRAGVASRNWQTLEASREHIDELSAEFALLEDERLALIASIAGDAQCNFYEVVRAFSPDLKADCQRTYRQLQRKLLLSKIENEAIDAYVSSAKKFINEVLENVIPQRRAKIYSKTGAVVRADTETLIVNQTR